MKGESVKPGISLVNIILQFFAAIGLLDPCLIFIFCVSCAVDEDLIIEDTSWFHTIMYFYSILKLYNIIESYISKYVVAFLNSLCLMYTFNLEALLNFKQHVSVAYYHNWNILKHHK